MNRRDVLIAITASMAFPYVLATTRNGETRWSRELADMNARSPINKIPSSQRREVTDVSIPVWTSLIGKPKMYYPPEFEISVFPDAKIGLTKEVVDSGLDGERRIMDTLRTVAEEVSDGRHVFAYASTRFGGWHEVGTTGRFRRVVSLVYTWDSCAFTPDTSGQYFNEKRFNYEQT